MQESNIQVKAQKFVDRIRCKYYVMQFLAVTLLILIAGSLFQNTNDRFIFTMILYFIIPIVLYIIGSFRWRVSYFDRRKINSILWDNCDPELFIEVCKIIEEGAPLKNEKKLVLGIANGLIMSGRVEEAYGKVQQISLKNNESVDVVLYYGILVNYAATRGDFNEIKTLRSEVVKIRETNIINFMATNMSCMLLLMIDAMLAEHFENYDTALELWKRAETLSKHIASKVAYQSRIAKLYYRKGDFDQARQYYDYVVENGNKLYHVSKLKKDMF